MKRKLYFLAILMCILGGFNLTDLHAQTTVTIGDGMTENWSQQIPIKTDYEYTLTQQIYLQSEIGTGAGTISSIAFQASANFTRTIAIYMVNTDKSSFNSANGDFVALPEGSMVYDGSVSFKTEEWKTIDITPFNYTGGNLLVCVYNKTGQYSMPNNFLAYTAATDNTVVGVMSYNELSSGFKNGGTISGTSSSFWDYSSQSVSGNIKNKIQLTITAGEGGGETPEPEPEPSTDIDPAKYYRIKVASGTGTGEYLTIFNYDEHANGSVGGVGTSATSGTYEQIFKLEKANDGGYYLLSQNGYYIYCQSWNVDALSNKKSSLSGFVIGSEFQISNNNNLNSNSSKKWFKVENASGGKYIFCDATSSNVTWILEEVIELEPAVPTGLMAFANSHNSVNLSWNVAENATGYNVYQEGELIASVSGVSHQVTGLDAENNYCFTVTAVNGSKESGHSGSACAMTPEEPEMCNVIFTLKDSYGDDWNGGYLVVEYLENQEILEHTGGSTSTHTLSIPQGTYVYIKLKSGTAPHEVGFTITYDNGVNIFNFETGTLSYSDTGEFPIFSAIKPLIIDCTLPIPDAPVVKAVATSRSSINLTWEDVDLAISYNVYDNNGDILAEGLTETSYSVTGLDASTNYCFTVIAVGESGESDPAKACATTLGNMSEGVIGDGSSENYSIPIEAYYNHSFSQQFYTKEEILAAGGCEGLITSLAYHVQRITTSHTSRNLKIYMTNVDELNEVIFGSGDVSCSLNTNDLVFEGNINFTEDWVKIPFITPFSYNGNHISITVIDNTGVRDGNDIYFTVHNKFTNNTNWTANKGNNDTPIDPTSLMGIGNGIRNDIKLSFVSEDVDIEFIGTGAWNDFENWNVKYVPTADKDVTISGEAYVTNDVTINSITINGGSLIVESNNSLTINGNMTNDDASAFVLKDGGQLFQNNADLQGTFVMNIKNPSEWSEWNKTGWQFIASPFTNAAVSQFTSADVYDLYKFEGDSLTEEWRNHKAASDKFEKKFVSGRGYMASYQNNTTATLSGTFNNATSIDYTVTYQDIQEGKPHWPNFHLLGNPFTFDMDVEKLSMTNMATGVAMVNDGGTYDYMTTGTIKVGDGFFVKSMAAKPSVSYGVATRGGNDDNTSDNISVRVSSSATRDNVVLNFAGSDKAGFPKLNAFNEDAAYLYVVSEEQRYGIFNYDKDVNEVSLSFEAQKMGKYTISVDAEGEYETIVLVDRQTGIETNMLLEDYSFTATSSSKENTDRFLVRFTFRSDVNEEAKHFAYQSGDELIIEAEGTVQLFDVTGRMLYIGEVESHGERINVGHLNNAAYILRLVNEEGVKVQKVIIY